MKTSNKLLLGLLATILISISTIFFDIRVFGTHVNKYRVVTHSENYPLESFSHVIVSNQTKTRFSPSFNIVSSDKNHIEIAHYSDSAVHGFEHHIINDTLMIYNMAGEPLMHTFNLYIDSEIESITTEGANITLQGIRQDSIKMYVKRGEINSWGKDTTDLSKFKNLKIRQLNSRINFHNIEVDTLQISMVKSSAGISKEIRVLNADIKDKSSLDLKHASHLIVDKDNSSKIYLR